MLPGKKKDTPIKTKLKILLFVFVALACGSSSSPHRAWLRNKVASQVVQISNKAGSGGTGVHVRTPSGKVYILTNAHVCGLADASENVLVTDGEQRDIPRRVLERSDFTDLCLVEPLANKSGLSVGNSISIGSVYNVLGHPHLMPLAMTSGEILGERVIQILDHVMDESPSDTCSLPKNKIVMGSFFGFPMKFCTVSINSYLSNITILPGNSGSPLFDERGVLRGLVYAGDNEVHWGLFIRIDDINTFLAPY